MSEQVWWYAARAGGLVAWALLTASVLWGVALSTRLVGRAVSAPWLLDLHRALGGLACMFTAVHVAGLVADSWVHIGWSEVLVPLASRWHPVGVAWGVTGMYLLVAVELTSLLGRRVPRRLWRRVHALSFGLWIVSTIHLLAAGTDASNRLVLTAAWVSMVFVVFVIAVRVLSPRPDRRPRPAVTDRRPSAVA